MDTQMLSVTTSNRYRTYCYTPVGEVFIDFVEDRGRVLIAEYTEAEH